MTMAQGHESFAMHQSTHNTTSNVRIVVSGPDFGSSFELPMYVPATVVENKQRRKIVIARVSTNDHFLIRSA